jgi:peptide/nickel transport system permease protein
MAEMSPDTTNVPDRSARSLGRKPMSLQLKIGLLLTLTIVLLGLLAPWIAPHPWDTISIKSRFLPPNSTYWLGTDEFGRDVLSRVLMGTGLSIAMGVSATLVSLAIGIPIGLAAGYFQGRTDEVLMRFADVLMAVPPIMLGLLVLAVTPPSLWKTALTVGFVYIPPIARDTLFSA